jgi:hypothetical protein
MLTSLQLKRLCEALPKVRSWFRIVENIAHAEYGMHRVSARDVEDANDHIHPSPGQLFLSLFRERGKSSPEVPIGSVQQPQHDVSGFGTAIWKTVWNSRVTVGA